MGIRLVVKGADFSDEATGYISPVSEGLEYLNFFGLNAATMQRNLAPGKPLGVMIGSPTINANSAIFTNLVNYIQTSIADVSSKTLFVVARVPTPKAESILMSNSRSQRPTQATTSTATSMMFRGPSDPDAGEVGELLFAAQWDGVNDSSSVPGTITIPNRPVGSLSALVGRTNSGDGTLAATKIRKLDNKTTGAKTSSSFSNAYFDLAGTFRVGSSYTSFSGTVPTEVLFAAFWSRELTDVEVETMYQAVKTHYAQRGISI